MRMPITLCLGLLTAAGPLSAQTFVPNYDEAKVPVFTLPDPLTREDGSKVTTKEQWPARRAELYSLFAREEYGYAPPWKGSMDAELWSEDRQALGGIAVRKEIGLTLHQGGKKLTMALLLYLPKTGGPAPVFLGYNFRGNQSVDPDPGIRITPSWVSDDKALGITGNKAGAASRGGRSSRWPLRQILSRGYGLATVYYGDVDPDFDDGFHNGVHRLFDTPRDSTSWGSIAAWAWALSRVMDYLEKDKGVDAKRVFVFGHSRLGKTALWAGASDNRFAMVISNESGCGGAALSKRAYGETVGRINTAFPHWFCTRFRTYNNRESALPFDQHELIALIAPRPVYVASAEGDQWSDPKGEFLGALYAEPVYALFGYRGLGISEMPPTGHPVVGDVLAYHIREGKHDITPYDWAQYLDFADRHFKSRR